MFDVGFSEIVFFGIIAVVILGPDKFPEVIRYIAKLKVKFNALKNGINQTIQNELELSELKNHLNNEIVYVENLEKRLNDYFIKNNIESHIGFKLSQPIKYYPIDFFKCKIPYQQSFILNNLMNFSCFKIQ